MFGIENYLGFILAAILLNLTPGTDSIYIITRSVSQGQTAGFHSVLGITSGILVHTLLASLGLSVLLASSPMAFMIVKYIGAAYLCYLGLKMLLSKNSNSIASSLAENQNLTGKSSKAGWQTYKQGVLTNVFNPKVALFFLAFLPQFIDSSYAYGMLSFLMLGITFAVTGFIWFSCLSLLSSRFSKSLREKPSIETLLNKISGVIFFGLGIKLLTEKA
ncbi:LysE family translocator [Psychrobacter sp. SWN149]|uniref:LysE family translocator n=1 Tax=Psychrobacter sp. SWN149 TaxID=2792057 RepID=UPI0018CE6BFB|nr:LysE family translocator [Psychrobacter sp. SWN149]MBH0007199.1 LysE family translocator [Psychrobacter sp. SWN149]